MKEYGLPGRERIKSKKEFELLYSAGSLIYSQTRKLKALYLFQNETITPGVKTAFPVSKKSGKAVWRNRVRRLLKESYRLNKKALSEKCADMNKLLLLAVSPNNINEKKLPKPVLSDVRDDVVYIIEQLESKSGGEITNKDTNG